MFLGSGGGRVGVVEELVEVTVAGRRPGGVLGGPLLGGGRLLVVGGALGSVHGLSLPRTQQAEPGEDGPMAITPKDELFKLAKRIHPLLIRCSGGRLGTRVSGMPVVVVTTTGRKTGRPRPTPLTAIEADGHTYVVASKGGDDRHPAWYLNLVAHPDVVVERDGTSKPMVARVLTSDERTAVWPLVTRTYEGYAGYQKKTAREIPVIELVSASR